MNERVRGRIGSREGDNASGVRSRVGDGDLWRQGVE